MNGLYVGRDAAAAQIVIDDPRVSKRHFWVGLRNGAPVVIDQGSTNGTFLNASGTQRVTEAFLNPDDAIVLCEADVARFKFVR